jgi:colanic acid/amylovoran biosynthesis glycosyltransferase
MFKLSNFKKRYMMKIAFLVKHFPRLSETFILNQITGLIDRGHDVKVFALKNPKDTKLHEDIIKYDLLNKVHYFYPENITERVSKALLVMFKYTFKEPLTVLKAINVFKYSSNAASLELLFFVEAFLKEDFDILHCQFGPLGILGAYLKDVGINVKLITSFRGYDITSLLKSRNKHFYDFLFKKGDLFLPVNDFFRKKLINLGCDERKIKVHHSGIDIDKFRFQKKYPEEKIVLLTTGRLVEKKGHQYVILAIKQVVKKYDNIKYIIAGEGPLRNKLEKMVNNLNLNHYVYFMGAVSGEETKKLYENAHIFILHCVTASNGDMEGTPVVLMEAQACGLPVVSTYHSGVSEVVIDGKSGFLVNEKDVNALVEKIEYLIENPSVWAEMGLIGRKHVEKNYNIAKLNDELEKKYLALLQRD